MLQIIAPQRGAQMQREELRRIRGSGNLQQMNLPNAKINGNDRQAGPGQTTSLRVRQPYPRPRSRRYGQQPDI